MIKDKNLIEAVNSFVSAMINRLAEKEEQGYSGWDDKDEFYKKIWIDLKKDFEKVEWANGEKRLNLLIDIANRSMMLWNRYSKKLYKGL